MTEPRIVDQPHMVAAEFIRRLKHQLALQREHDKACVTPVGCVSAALISCGLADSWTTLAGIGFQREANDVCEQFKEGKL